MSIETHHIMRTNPIFIQKLYDWKNPKPRIVFFYWAKLKYMYRSGVIKNYTVSELANYCEVSTKVMRKHIATMIEWQWVKRKKGNLIFISNQKLHSLFDVKGKCNNGKYIIKINKGISRGDFYAIAYKTILSRIQKQQMYEYRKKTDSLKGMANATPGKLDLPFSNIGCKKAGETINSSKQTGYNYLKRLQKLNLISLQRNDIVIEQKVNRDSWNVRFKKENLLQKGYRSIPSVIEYLPGKFVESKNKVDITQCLGLKFIVY